MIDQLHQDHLRDAASSILVICRHADDLRDALCGFDEGASTKNPSIADGDEEERRRIVRRDVIQVVVNLLIDEAEMLA